MLDVRPHKHTIFTLADKRRRGSDDSLGSRDSKSLGEEPCEFLDEPGEGADVGEEGGECDEEDDGGEGVCEEVAVLDEISPEELRTA
jgi:hypothetical protein